MSRGGLSTRCYTKINLTNMADHQGAHAWLLKIYQFLKDVLDYLSDSELLAIIDNTCMSVNQGRPDGRDGESQIVLFNQ